MDILIKNRILSVTFFLLLNFAALGLGSSFTGDGVISDWYQNLNKAPWTPPGWVFGFAWTTIMVLFAIYMSELIRVGNNKLQIAILYTVQWILNVSWNPIFFKMHWMLLSVVVICSLTGLVAYFLINYHSKLKKHSFFVLPYLLWMMIASSLNTYAYLFN